MDQDNLLLVGTEVDRSIQGVTLQLFGRKAALPFSLKLSAVFTRRGPTLISKCQREVSLIGKAAHVCNLRDTKVCLFEQLSRTLDAPLENVAMRRQASCCMKNAEKMTTAVAAFGRELQKGEIGVQMAFDAFLYQVHDDVLTEPSDVQAMFDNIPVTDKKLQWVKGTTARWDGYLEFQRRPNPMLEWFGKHMA